MCARALHLLNSPRELNQSSAVANLPNQVHRKSVRKGFHFTCMVVGESGLGKSVSALLAQIARSVKTLKRRTRR